MRSESRTGRDARKLSAIVTLAGTNFRKTGELAAAASHVVAKRISLGAAATLDPMNADHAEFARIIPEKAQAFSEAGTAWFRWSGAIAQQMAGYAVRELATAAEATAIMAKCQTPAGMLAAQSRFAMGWLARAVSQSIALGSAAMRLQSTTMAPVLRVAMANARRFGR
jgi:hypothetical protein